MFSFESFLNLPLIWTVIIALAVFIYVCLDGFDLGVGIIYPFAPTATCRRRMLNSIAPFWDGNETWLILGGGGLFAAFPLAYSILMPALYVPVLTMLFALVFRGVAFEFHYKSGPKAQLFWNYAFHFGSLFAAFAQGTMLGAFIDGIQVTDRQFSGGPFDWATPFSMMTGLAVVCGYALLGSTWLIMKTDGETQVWARKVSLYMLFYVMMFMGLVSIWAPFTDVRIYDRWFSLPNMYYLSILPITVLIASFYLLKAIIHRKEYAPFLLTTALFALNYLGIIITMYPYMVPRSITFSAAAAVGPSQSLMLVGVVIILPVILMYTAYNYYVFRGKSTHEDMY